MATSPIEPQGDGRPAARAQLSGLIFAVILIDGEGRIAEVNHAAESLLGTSASRIIGTRLIDRIGPLDARVEARLRQSDEALVARDLAATTGAGEARIMFRHVFANGATPALTVFGMQFGWMLGATVLVEEIFGRPGIGRVDRVLQGGGRRCNRRSRRLNRLRPCSRWAPQRGGAKQKGPHPADGVRNRTFHAVIWRAISSCLPAPSRSAGTCAGS